MQAANGEILQPDECRLKYLENDVDEGRFSVQLSMIPDLIKDVFQDIPIIHQGRKQKGGGGLLWSPDSD